MSDDDRTEIEKIAESLAGKVNKIGMKPEPEPEPEPVKRTYSPPQRTYSPPRFDYERDYRPTSRPVYQRDRWAPKPTTYGQPSRMSLWEPLDQDRPRWTEDDVDWELAKTIRIDRSTTYPDFTQALGVPGMSVEIDGEVSRRLSGIFMNRKSETFRR
jgi:hypothetical protein